MLLPLVLPQLLPLLRLRLHLCPSGTSSSHALAQLLLQVLLRAQAQAQVQVCLSAVPRLGPRRRRLLLQPAPLQRAMQQACAPHMKCQWWVGLRARLSLTVQPCRGPAKPSFRAHMQTAAAEVGAAAVVPVVQWCWQEISASSSLRQVTASPSPPCGCTPVRCRYPQW